jgi:hypothetical protein
VRPHIAILRAGKLEEIHWETLPYPTYRPDFVPSDFHLFGPLEETIQEKRFKADNEVKDCAMKARQANTNLFEKSIIKLSKCLVNFL